MLRTTTVIWTQNKQCAMESSSKNETTPGGRSTSTICTYSTVSRPTDSGEPAPMRKEKSESPKTPFNLRRKMKAFLATFNANSLLKPGKVKQLTTILAKHKIFIAAIQETRFPDSAPFESDGFRIFKSKTERRILKGVPHLGTGFIVDKRILPSITDFKPISNRLCTLSFKCTNKIYTIVNAHAPIDIDNIKDPETVETYWELLENKIREIPKNHVIILLGDFNAQLGKEPEFQDIIGKYPAHKKTKKNGQRLVQLCRNTGLLLKSTFFCKSVKRMKTWTSPNPLIGEFQLDHVAISRNSVKEIRDVKVLRGANLDSDHYLSKIRMNFIPKTFRPLTDIKRLRPNTEKLRLESKEFSNVLSKHPNITFTELESLMTKTALQIAPQTRKPRHAWWSPECDNALDRRLQAWKNWSAKKTPENFALFVQARKEASRIIRSVKRNYNKSQMSAIEEHFAQHKTRNFYQTFKRNLTKYTPPSLNFIDPKTKKIAHSDDENCHLLAQYFENLLNCPPPITHFDKTTSKTTNPDSSPPDLEEIKSIVRSLKNNKASGENGIIAEHWKLADDTVLLHLEELLKQIWSTSQIPADWTTALIHPLHKKGDKKDVNNYRGISLLSVSYKILSKALLKRAEKQLDHQIGEYQAGFRKSRSCIDQIFCLKSIISRSKSRNIPLYVTFIDFQKAYDCVDRQTLFQILQEFGLDNKTREIIQATLTGTSSKVKFRSSISDPFQIKTGVRQGDGLSPLLFNCALEKVIRDWRTEVHKHKIPSGVTIGRIRSGISIDCLAFADDLALFAQTPESATAQINFLQDAAAKVGLQISYSKTKFISLDKQAPQTLHTAYGDVHKVDHFKYLGEWISPSHSEKKAMETRIQKLNIALHLTRGIYNKKCISQNAKLRHYQTVIRPEALYAAECLNLNNKGSIQKLEVEERKILRKIYGPIVKENYVRHNRPNSELYKNCEKLSHVIRKRRLAFYGHVHRMDITRLPKQLFDYFLRLKSQPTWFTNTRADLQALQISTSDIQGRSAFRTKIKETMFQDTPPKDRSFSVARKLAYSIRMKKWWADKKRACNN